MPDCTTCKHCACYSGENCFQDMDTKNIIPDSIKILNEPQSRLIHEVSSTLEAEFYMKYSRLEELIEFAKRMSYHKIGIAHCLGLISEAATLKHILDQSFEVHAICCKFSGTDKKQFALPQVKNNRFEAICNPVGQA